MSNQTNEDEQKISPKKPTTPLEELRQCVANLEEGFYNYIHKTDTDPENHKFIQENLRRFSQLWKSTDLSSDLRAEAQRHIVRLIGESPFTSVNFRTIRPSSVEVVASEARRVLLKEFQKLAQPSNFSYTNEIIKLLQDPTNISKLHAAFCCIDSILHHVFAHKSLNAVLAKTFPQIELILPSLLQQLKDIVNQTKKVISSNEPTKKEQENNVNNNNNNNSSNNENNADKLISKEGLMLGETVKTLLKIFGQGLSQVRISEKLWTVKSLESWLRLCQFILTGIDLSHTSYQSISPDIDFANPKLSLASLSNHVQQKTLYSVWWKCLMLDGYCLISRSPTLKIRGSLKKHIPNWTNMNLELLSQLSTGKLPWIVVHWCFMYFHQLILQMIPVSLHQVTTLLHNTLLPILGFSNMEYDLFTKNLPLYIRGVRAKIDQTDRIRHDIVSLIRLLIQQYPNYIYPVLFDYIDNLFSKSTPNETDMEILRRKEGVLYLMQTTGRKILSVPQYCDRIINAFKKHFIPEFGASCDLLRARVSVLFGVFMNSRRFQNQMGAESIKLCCENMVKSLRDPNLFVADKTAEALYLVIHNVDYPSLWQKVLKEDFDRLLDIFKETGEEAIIDTAENLLSSAEEVVVEVAPKICKRLTEDFLFYFEREHAAVMRTQIQGNSEDEVEPEWCSEYFLNPLQSLIDLCCIHTNTLNKVVDIILEKLFPSFRLALEDNPDIFQDFTTMLSVIAFHVQPFRPELWKYFDLLIDTTLGVDYEPEYFSPMIDFMFRDPKTFFENEHYVEKVWNLICGSSEVLDFWEVGTILEQLLSSATELANLRGLSSMQIRNLNKVANDIVPKIVHAALNSFKKAVPKNVFEVLLHCFMCCFGSVLPVFNSHPKSATLVFEFWLSCLNKIPPRMKRLNLFAMCGLFTVPSSQLPSIVQKNIQTILEQIVHSLDEIEQLKTESSVRWSELKIHKKGITPRSPRKRADSRKLSLVPPLTIENNENISNNNNTNLPSLPEDNPSLERVEPSPQSAESVFSKLGITLREEKKAEREYSGLFPDGEYYDEDDEDEEMDEENSDQEEPQAEEQQPADFTVAVDEDEEPNNILPEENQNEEEHEPFEDWDSEEDFDLGSDHSSDMAVGMYHNHEDASDSYDSEDQESSEELNDSEDEEEEEEDDDDSEDEEEDQLSSEEALELEASGRVEASKDKKPQEEEPTILDKIDELVFVYDALHRISANLDLIGLLSMDDANLLKDYFEVALQRKVPPPLLDQCIHYVISNLKRFEDQIKRLPEDILFKLQKFVITFRVNLSDEEIQLLKFNQQS